MMNFVKKLFAVLLCWLLILAVLFMVGEICFRLFRHEQNALAQITQKNAGALLTPDVEVHSVSSIPGEYDYTAHVNHYGFRGRDFVTPKPDDTLRVLAIGDSFTFGVGAEDNETIPAVLEKSLRPKFPTVEIVNAGVGHASPIVYWANMRNIYLKAQPDVVVLLLDLTDLADDWSWERHAIFDRSGNIEAFDLSYVNGKRDWWVTAVQHSAFCRYIHNRLVRSFEKISVLGWKEYFKLAMEGKRAKAAIATAMEGKAAENSIEFDGMMFMRGKAKEKEIRANFQRTARYLRLIRQQLNAEGIPMVIVMYPHGIYVGGNQWHEGRKFWGFEQGKRYTDYLAFDTVREFSRREKIPFINTVAHFPREPKEKYFFDWDGHMTPIGYKTVAEAIAADPAFLKVMDEIARKNHLNP